MALGQVRLVLNVVGALLDQGHTQSDREREFLFGVGESTRFKQQRPQASASWRVAKAKSNGAQRAPKVRIVSVGDRTLQLRYIDPDTKKEVRISTRTHDRKQAEKQQRALAAELRQGERPRPTSKTCLSWAEFRRAYRELKQFQSVGAKESAEVRLDICEKLVAPKRLREMADPKVLARLQAQLLTSRSEHTVKSYMQTLVAALNWTCQFGWLGSRIKYEAIRTGKLETHKGRPITEAEFDAMLAACDVVCAGCDPESRKFLLRGLWHSGLRLGEACQFAWDIPTKIRPFRHRSGHVVLQIPAALQKNKRDQTVPTIRDFANLLDEVPLEQRTGFVFNPQKRRGEGRYADPKDVGRVNTAIGKQAGVYVSETKPASAHDLRRSFGQRLAVAGVSPRDLQAIMRHREFSTTQKYYLKDEAAEQAERIFQVWDKSGYGGANRTQQETETATPEESPQVIDP